MIATNYIDLGTKADHFAKPLKRLIVSVDLGQTVDPTAIAILEVQTRRNLHDQFWRTGIESADNPHPPRDWYDKNSQLKFGTAPASMILKHLERLPMRMPYPAQMDHVAGLLRRLPKGHYGPDLLFDMTGVGRPVVDMARRSGLRPIGVTITAGQAQGRDPESYDDWRVAKLLLVSRLQAAMHEKILFVPATLSDAKALVQELQDFRATINDTGYARFGAREGAHDDLVLAVAIAVWYASRELDTATTHEFYV